jgi:glycosyltransferase involved in cell wall biosynthesis
LKVIGVNGRFLSQKLTGVQRYALNILDEMDKLVSEGEFQGLRLRLFRDANAAHTPDLRNTEVESDRSSGYRWEQLSLPAKPFDALISLCNVGPLASRKQIVCIHDTNVYDVPDSYSRPFRAAYKLMLPTLGRTAAGIFTVSQNSRERLYARKVVPRSREIGLAPNGFEHTATWTENPADLADKLKGRRFVLLVGSYAKHKNFELVLDNAASLAARGLSVVVVGAPGEVFNDLPLVRKEENVLFLGRVSDDGLAWLYRRALALAMPSRNEGFGLPALEAMALGCPVICSGNGSLPEVCGDAGICIRSDRSEDWLRAIEMLAADEQLRARLSEKGLDRKTMFSWRESARAILRKAAEVAVGPVPSRAPR